MKLIENQNDRITFAGLPQLPCHDLLYDGRPLCDCRLSDSDPLSDGEAN